MIREVVQPSEQQQADALQLRESLLDLLRARVAPDIAEFTIVSGCVTAVEFYHEDYSRPLTGLARSLRRVADEVERIAKEHGA